MKAIVVAACLLTSTAFADRISGSPPTDCPAGSYPHVDHGGPHCAIVRCTSDDECTAWDPELRCGPEASLCIVTDEFNTYTRRPHQRERAGAACVDGACAEGACETRRFCVKGTTPEPQPEPEPAQPEPETMQSEMQSESTMQSAETQNESSCSAGGSAGSAWLLLLFLCRRRR